MGRLILIVLVLIASPAQAQVYLHMCATMTYVEKVIQTKLPNWRRQNLTPEETSVFMANFNAEPPATSYVVNEIVILWTPSEHAGAVLFFKNGCMRGKSNLTRALIYEYLGKELPATEL